MVNLTEIYYLINRQRRRPLPIQSVQFGAIVEFWREAGQLAFLAFCFHFHVEQLLESRWAPPLVRVVVGLVAGGAEQQQHQQPAVIVTSSNMTSQEASEPNEKSALQDSLERKGANSYYFAHSHKANGPQWDGKAEPKLLSKQESHEGHRVTMYSTFEYSKSNITTYAFLDGK